MKSKKITTMSIQDIKKKTTPVFKKYGVKKAALFGSAVHGTMTKKSDIDFLIRLDGEKKTLLDLVRIKNELEKIVGREVDVLTYNSLHPLLKDRILNEQKIIYAKRT